MAHTLKVLKEQIKATCYQKKIKNFGVQVKISKMIREFSDK